MLRAVLFDLDGTLFDRATTVQRCIEHQHRRFEAMLTAVSEAHFVNRFVQLDAHGYVKKDQVYSQLGSDYGLAPGVSDALLADFYLHYHKHAVAFDGVHELLAGLRHQDLRLGLVTNGGTLQQRSTIDALKIGDYFDAILISDSEGIRKPDSAIFTRALSRLSVAAADAMFVGDHPIVDVRGASDAGLYTVWKANPCFGECLHADASIDAISELASVMLSFDFPHKPTHGPPAPESVDVPMRNLTDG